MTHNNPTMNKNYLNFKFLQVAGILAIGIQSSSAAFITGFETSSGYGTNTTVIGVHDSSAPGTNAWERFASLPSPDSRMVTSTANPQTGTQALRFINDGSGTALATTLQLGSSVNVANPFNIHFGMALNNISAGTGNQAQVYFGFNGSQLGVQPYWFSLIYNDGSLNLYLNNAANNNIIAVNLGLYTTYSALGSYISFDFAIDPATNKFTNVQITGTLTSANLTSTVLAAAGGGTIPHLSATPNTYFSFTSGGNDTITADFDNLQITTIPEPSTNALIMGSFALGIMVLFRRRLSKSA